MFIFISVVHKALPRINKLGGKCKNSIFSRHQTVTFPAFKFTFRVHALLVNYPTNPFWGCEQTFLKCEQKFNWKFIKLKVVLREEFRRCQVISLKILFESSPEFLLKPFFILYLPITKVCRRWWFKYRW